jgi:PAS domain S-box-containing protein
MSSSSSLHSLAFDGSPEPLAVVEGDAIQASNAAWRAQVGEPISLRACFDPGDLQALGAALEEAGGGRASLVARLAGVAVSPRGPLRWTLWPAGDAAICVRLDGPAPGGDVGTSTEQTLLRVFGAIDACLWSVRRDGTITLSEGNGLAHYGLKPGQVVGANAFQIFPEGSHAYETTVRTLAGERLRDELVDGEIHWVQLTEPLRGEGGEVEAMIGFNINVSPNLLETGHAKHLMKIINSMPLVVWAARADGTCTLSAGKNLELVGFSPGELVGRNLFELYRDEPFIREHLHRVLAGEVTEVEGRYGDRTWFTAQYPTRNGIGEVTGVYAISQDVTERKQVEQRMREQLELIQAQQRVIVGLVSPIIEVWRGVLVVPVIGALGEDRAALLTEKLLDGVVRRGARFAILDLTGVDAVDTDRACHLVNIMRSVELLGCTCLLSGIRPSVAMAMVALDVEMPADRSHPTLAEALRRCLRSPDLGPRGSGLRARGSLGG